MAYSAGYWVDLAKYSFDDSDGTTWIQAMPIGSYEHPVHGTIEINADRVQRFADNVAKNVRGQDLDIDYDHKERSGEAAGWVRAADARPDGLWLQVEWTKSALQKLKEKAYRYFSPEFHDEWQNPTTKALHKDVLFGGGITNRPFLKGIQPINMSEVFEHASDQSKSNEGGSGMKPEQLKSFATKLGLGDDATEDQVLAELDTLEIVDAQVEPVKEPIAASEPDAATKKLMEENPTIKALVESNAAMATQLAENTAALRLSEVNNTVAMLAEKARLKKVALPPTMLDEMTATLLTPGMSKTLSETLVKGYESVIEAKIVQLGEIGKGRGTFHVVRDEEEGTSALSEINVKVKKLREDDKALSYEAAVAQVASSDEELYTRYRAEISNGTEN